VFVDHDAQGMRDLAPHWSIIGNITFAFGCPRRGKIPLQ
jgi:hypothetical protein